MDIQFVGDYSTALVTYIVKYILKSEKNLEKNVLKSVSSNKNLSRKLWNFAMRSLYNRECGSIEAADVCLMNSLYCTDNDTIIKWLNVFMIRNKRVLPINQIKELQERSENVFYVSFIDDVYPNCPQKLEGLCLYEFVRWYELKPKKPSNVTKVYYEIEQNNFSNEKVVK